MILELYAPESVAWQETLDTRNKPSRAITSFFSIYTE